MGSMVFERTYKNMIYRETDICSEEWPQLIAKQRSIGRQGRSLPTVLNDSNAF